MAFLQLSHEMILRLGTRLPGSESGITGHLPVPSSSSLAAAVGMLWAASRVVMEPVPDYDDLIWLFESEPTYPYADDERDAGYELGWRATWPYTTLDFTTVRSGVRIDMTIKPGYNTVQLRLRPEATTEDLVNLDLRDVLSVSVERNRDHELLRMDFPSDAAAATLWLRLKPSVLLVWSHGRPRRPISLSWSPVVEAGGLRPGSLTAVRSAAELRQRCLHRLPEMITRAGMWTTGNGSALDVQLGMLLDDLCWLDGNDSNPAVRDVRSWYGKLGVVGPFVAMFGNDGRYLAEVASVWAEHAHRLGYLTVDRLLDADEWNRLAPDRLRERFDGKDVRRSEAEAEYGTPSLVADKRTLCYAPADGTGWVFMDCYTQPTTGRYVPGKGTYEGECDEDPLVRSVRHPAATFEAGLILTLYGKVLRWGPGWWLEQPTGLNDEQRAIAMQLRDIEAADPSQSLKPPRGHPNREPGT